MLNLFGVVECPRSMVNWSEGTTALSICVFCCLLKLFVLSGIQYIYGGVGGGYMCKRYVCILLYLDFIQCSGML